MGEIEQAAADDSDAAIDPRLWDTMDSMMAMNGSVSASHVPVSAHSQPVSTMRGPTPNVVAVNRACSVTPVASTVFQPTARHLGAVPPKPVPPAGRDLSVPFNQFQTPDLPSDCCPGFSTGTAPLQRSAVTSLSTSRVPSTAFVDKLANLDMIVAQLADKFDCLALQSRDSVEFKSQIEELTQENHTLRVTVEDHHTVIHKLQTTIDAQSTSLEELLVLINELRSSGTVLPTVKSVNKATKVMHDNVFNNVIWHTFLHAMGISDSKQAMLLGVLDGGSFWFKCPTHDTNLLQPNFAGSWSENAEWCEDIVRYVQQKACKVFTQLPVEHLKQKTDTNIIKQLKEVFENTRESIKKGSKGQDAQEVRNCKQWQTAQKNCVNEKVVLLNDAVNLPKLANKKHKIPQQFVDANWLAENPKMDVPSQIDDDIPVQSCDPEICRDEDTLYEGGDEEDVEEQVTHLKEQTVSSRLVVTAADHELTTMIL
ncbi:uncharacterized protein BJ212DRAFT_1299331 [Suillus subaureus]|uniref:Uncharacterized protein n=1 Tax=Suillus subaureus TaxID=48587 RepID=A0A9P7ECC0_9AGAM|nr:uncharacterized protein BJ212DRAFT_1299331 [Suillus subaureus]KAG1817169.1 hypothetical protein BJ212DRAFT_1299331 [Suillus subaureus]